MTEKLDYGSIMNHAMRIFVKEVLQKVSEHGLPGEHHFFITLDTKHPNIEIAAWLTERYPDEITIVMQHWYENLEVGDEGFSITLNFGDAPEPLYIPYDCIITFVDPSVEFGVKFEPIPPIDASSELTEALQSISAAHTTKNKESKDISTEGKEPKGVKAEGEVVQFDTFRK
jgi:hypothetical protein